VPQLQRIRRNIQFAMAGRTEMLAARKLWRLARRGGRGTSELGTDKQISENISLIVIVTTDLLHTQDGPKKETTTE